MISAFRVFDPTPCKFPAAEVAALPPPNGGSFGCLRSSRFFALGDDETSLFYKRGRYALLDAYRFAGVGPGGALLAPAYHCRTMIDPAVRLGAEVLLFSVEHQLAPDRNSLEQLLRECSVPIRALLLPRYFGFPQDFAWAHDFCREFGLVLIEDCSHAHLHSRDVARPGTYSQYVVSSPYKFAPCDDGGLLLAGKGVELAARELRRMSVLEEVKCLARTLARIPPSRKPGRPSDSQIESSEFERCAATEFDQPGDTLSALYNIADEEDGGHRISRAVMLLSNNDRIAIARRRNFRRWVSAVATLPGCHALFPELPDGCVPYMFPLYIDKPDRHFYDLKYRGVPIWRWDEMAVSDCPIANDYRLRLIHLPCHQALSENQMAWMIEVVSSVMKEGTR